MENSVGSLDSNTLESTIVEMFYNALPIGRNKRIRKIGQHYDCPLCENSEELIQHLFQDCWLSKLLLWVSLLPIKVDADSNVPWTQWVCDWILSLNHTHNSLHIGANIFVAIVWSIWIFRNLLLFQVAPKNPFKMVDILQN